MAVQQWYGGWWCVEAMVPMKVMISVALRCGIQEPVLVTSRIS